MVEPGNLKNLNLKLVVNADDLFYSPVRDSGILHLLKHRKGCVSDCSALVNGYSFTSLSFEPSALLDPVPGWHLNFTEGLPCAHVEQVASLLNENGSFMGKFGFRKALAEGAVKEEHMEAEAEAQLRQFMRFLGQGEDQPPSHVDGHQHIHLLKQVRPVVIKVAKKYKIPWIRLSREYGIEKADWLPDSTRKFYESVNADCAEAAQEFTEAGLRFPDLFLGLSLLGPHMNLQHFQQVLKLQLEQLPERNGDAPIVVEFMVHPGCCCLPGEAGCGTGADDFSQDEAREHELKFLSPDSEFCSFLQQEGIKLSSFQELCQ